MGFGKGKKANRSSTETETESSDKKRHDDGFKPTTDDELKEISRKARNRERAKNNAKGGARNRAKPPRGEALREALVSGSDMPVYESNMFAVFAEECKQSSIAIPRYAAYEKEKKAQANFVFEVSSALSHLGWRQLTRILHAGVSASESPIGLATRSWTEAFEFAQHVMFLALTVRDKNGVYSIGDPDTLNDWPAPEKKRPTKEDRMAKAEKAKAKARERDEDEDDEDENEEEDESSGDDEDEDEESTPKKKSKPSDDDDEDDEDDEDEEPAPKKSKKSAKDDDEDDDSDDDAGDDDEDDDESTGDDDEEPEAARKSGRGKRAQAKRRVDVRADDEDEDEEDDPKPKKSAKKFGGKAAAGRKRSVESDDEDDEESAPVKKGKGEEKVSKASKNKSAKGTNGRANGETKFRVAKKWKGGVREECQSAISGDMTLDKIQTVCKKRFKMPPNKTRAYVSWLAANGYLRRV